MGARSWKPALRSRQDDHRRMRSRARWIIRCANQTAFPQRDDANIFGECAPLDGLRRNDASVGLGGEGPGLRHRLPYARGWSITSRRPDKLHRIREFYAAALIAPDGDTGTPDATVAVHPDRDLLSGLQSVERQSEALVDEDVVWSDLESRRLSGQSSGRQ